MSEEVSTSKSDDTLVTCFFDDPPSASLDVDHSRSEKSLSSPAAGTSMSDAEQANLNVGPLQADVALRLGSERISLLGGGRFILGRHRSCDIISPVAPSGDAAARRRSLKVSRRHCEIILSPSGWTVRDGVESKHSSFGTWWNGEQVAEAVPLGGVPGILSLGGPSAVDSVAFDVRMQGGSLVLSSYPSAAEMYVLLADEVALERLDSRLSGLWASFVGGRIRWRRGGETGAFVPGTPIPGVDGGFWVE